MRQREEIQAVLYAEGVMESGAPPHACVGGRSKVGHAHASVSVAPIDIERTRIFRFLH